MPNVQGQIEKVYHNFMDKQGNNLPPNKVNHKIKMNGELYIIKGVHCPEFIKEGTRVSIAYNVWKQPSTGMDHYYVLKRDNGDLCVNDLSNNQSDDFTDDDLDDKLDNGGNAFSPPTQTSSTDFDVNQLEKEGENPQVVKEQQIFCTALLKSSIEANQLKSNDLDAMNKAILHFKDIYNKNFK
jgi:hypothetical protein